MERQSSRFDWAHSSIFRSLHVLFWWWLNPILSLGYKRELTDEDLDDLSMNDRCSVLLNKLNYYSDNNYWLSKYNYMGYNSTSFLETMCFCYIFINTI